MALRRCGQGAGLAHVAGRLIVFPGHPYLVPSGMLGAIQGDVRCRQQVGGWMVLLSMVAVPPRQVGFDGLGAGFVADLDGYLGHLSAHALGDSPRVQFAGLR